MTRNDRQQSIRTLIWRNGACASCNFTRCSLLARGSLEGSRFCVLFVSGHKDACFGHRNKTKYEREKTLRHHTHKHPATFLHVFGMFFFLPPANTFRTRPCNFLVPLSLFYYCIPHLRSMRFQCCVHSQHLAPVKMVCVCARVNTYDYVHIDMTFFPSCFPYKYCI